MAKNKKTNNLQELQNIIEADYYGFSQKYMESNKAQIDKITTSINNITTRLSYGTPEQVNRNLFNLNRLTEYTSKNRRDLYGLFDNLNNNSTNDGFRPVSGSFSSGTNDEHELISFSESLMSPYIGLVSEYRNVARLIPEIRRCMKMITRDILSTNEITKKSIYNVYNDPNVNKSENVKLGNISTINDCINDIIEQTEIETIVERCIEDSLIEGAKVVTVIPYRDIIEMVNIGNKKNNISQESIDNCIDETLSKDNDYHRLLSLEDYNNFSLSRESFDVDTTYDNSEYSLEEENKKLDDLIHGIVGDDKLLDDFYTEHHSLLSSYVPQIGDDNNNADGLSKLPKSLYQESKGPKNQKFNQIVEEAGIKPDIKAIYNKHLLEVIKGIDDKIEVYDDDTSTMNSAIDAARKILKHNALQDNRDIGFISYGPRSRNYTDSHEISGKGRDPYGIINSDKDQLLTSNYPNKDKPKFKSVLDVMNNGKLDDDFLNDCIIKQYDSEDVIPVIVSGKHVGYYVLEVSAYTGNTESINKTHSNFTDMFLQMGFNNDNALASNSGFSINGVNGGAVPSYGSGTTNGDFAPANTSIGSNIGMGFGNGSLSASGMSNDPAKRNECLKKIMFNLIKRKIKNKDIEEDKNFKEIVMNIIREGSIINNDIKFTYIPEKYVVYFTPQLDTNGVPVPLLKDLLFTCYLYISSLMTSALVKINKSSIRDKMTINIGATKNLALSIRNLEQSLSTKKINVESSFTSLARVLKVSSTTDTIYEPVYNGEKIYDLSEMTRMNDISMDDTWTEKLLNTIITGLNSPLSIMSGTDADDLASVHASRHAEYRLGIIQRQSNYNKSITKFVKLVIVSKGVPEKFKDKEFNIDNVEVVLSPPEYLNMKNSTELFSTVKSYVDEIIAIMYDENDDTEALRYRKNKFRKQLYKKYMPGLDWELFESMVKEIDNDIGSDLVDTKINKSVSETWERDNLDLETGYEADDDDSSSGGDDSFGGDDGGDSGGFGDDDGGFDEGGFDDSPSDDEGEGF